MRQQAITIMGFSIATVVILLIAVFAVVYVLSKEMVTELLDSELNNA